MVAKVLPEDERLRLAILHCLQIFDIPLDQRFDRITRLVASHFGIAIATINALGEPCERTPALTGQSTLTAPSGTLFCAQTAVEEDDVYIEDLQQDARFRDHPLVVDTPHLRFYASIPLRNAAGSLLGALYIADTQPRRLSAAERSDLHDFAAWAVQELIITDVSAIFLQQQGEEDALRIRETRSRTMIEAINEGVVLQDRDGTIHTWNTSAERILALSTAELQESTQLIPRWPAIYEDGRAVSDANHPATIALQTGEPQMQAIMCINKPDEATLWLAVNAHPVIYPHEATPGGVVLSFFDVTEQKRLEQQLQQYRSQLEAHNAQLEVLAATDGLTGLMNRRVLAEQLDIRVQQAQHHQQLALILLDVDYFKAYNDTFGHPAGDSVLQQIGRLLFDHSRHGDTVARYGGEEFVLLLPNTDLSIAMIVAERLRAVIAAKAWPRRPITASFGVASLNDAVTTGAALLRVADIALYKAKHNGRNCVVGAHSLRQYEVG